MLDLGLFLAIAGFFAVLAVLAWRVGNAPYVREGRTQAMQDARQEAFDSSLVFRASDPLIRGIARVVPRLGIGGHLEWLRKSLAYAGHPRGRTPEEVVATSILWSTVGFASALVFSLVLPLTPVLVILGLSLLVHTVACLALNALVDKRRTQVTNGLPYFMDLVSLSMDAGATFPNACRAIADGPVKGPVEECVRGMLADLRAGVPQPEAIGNMLLRSDSEELEGMVAAVKQGEKLGTPLVDTLRRQAELSRFLRLKRGQQLAAKLPSRLALPTILMLLACLLLLLGPVLIKAFSEGFGGFTP